MGTAWIFAGQGAEEPGMGLELAKRSREARAWLDVASRVTGVDVPRALERGGRALARTEVLQPVLVAVGLASIEARADVPGFVAGHSLGELTAACWAAELPKDEAIELAALRGRLMADAAASCPGGMLAVRTHAEAELDALMIEGRAHGELAIAARNTEDEIVVSGDRTALAWLGSRVRGCSPLPVAGAWHSARMRPAVEPLRAELERRFAGRTLRAPLVSSCRVGEVSAEALPAVLSEGLVAPVRFLELVGWLADAGVDGAMLPAPSRTTRSLLRRAGGRRWTIEDAA